MSRHDPPSRRVWITGAGVVAAAGDDRRQLWDRIVAGRSAIQAQPEGLPFPAAPWPAPVDPRDPRKLDPVHRFALAASRAAVADAGLDPMPDAARAGAILASSRGPTATLETALQRWADGERVSPRASPLSTPGSLSGAVSVALGLRGPHYSLYATCASGAHAIGLAFQQIRFGVVDRMLAGGAEAALTPFGAAMFRSTGILTATQCRPFDARRDGTALADGAAVVLLEAESVARARGARPLAELVGYAATGDAHSWTGTHEDGRGLVAAMRGALADASLDPGAIDAVSAHATGTRRWDAAEGRALQSVFADRLASIAVHATKGATGHLIGATGALEAVLCAEVLRHGVVPPTTGLEEVDPALGFTPTMHASHEIDASLVLSNSAGFGGSNASLILRRAD